MKKLWLAVPVLFWAACAMGQGVREQAFPPHRVIGNVYYVGSKELATYLIVTPEGHALINSGYEETVPLIRASVEALGYKITDVKVLLASHAHSDHVAGHALLKELTGAKVYVMRGDDDVIASGGKGQYLYTSSRWKPCPVDRVLKDGDEVTLGGTTLIARRTPGHTRGCTTWTWTVSEGDKKYEVVVIGSPNVNPGYKLAGNADYPEIAADFAETFRVLKSLKGEVFLGAHGNYYDMLAKYERLQKKDGTNPFLDLQGYRAYVELKEQAYLKTLTDQKGGDKKDTAADQSAAKEQLKQAGAELTETAGVITAVTVKDGAKFTAAEFKLLGTLSGVKTFTWSGNTLDDAMLAHLAGMSALEDVSTNLAQFSDDGLKQWAAFSKLRRIKFFHTSLHAKNLNGSGFAQLTSLKNLRSLTVAGCPFNDEGLAAVGKLTQLEELRTWHTYQTEAGNRHLKSLTNLKRLHLGQRLRRYDGSSNALSLSDLSIDALTELKSLDTLILDESRFSLAALSRLKSLPHLKQLQLDRIDIPADDVERLKQTLTGAQVTWNPLTDESRTALERALKP